MKVQRFREILDDARGESDGSGHVEVCVDSDHVCHVTHAGVYAEDGPFTLVLDRYRPSMLMREVRQALEGIDGELDVDFVFRNKSYTLVSVSKFRVISDLLMDVESPK